MEDRNENPIITKNLSERDTPAQLAHPVAEATNIGWCNGGFLFVSLDVFTNSTPSRRNPQHKKHKTWDGDAILVLSETKAYMHDMESKLMGSGKLPSSELVREGAQFSFNGKELEVDRAVSREEFFSGSCFGSGGNFSAPAAPSSRYPGPSKQFNPPISATSKTSCKPPNAERRGIPLQPVDLLSTIDNSQVKDEFPKLKVEDSHWTANW